MADSFVTDPLALAFVAVAALLLVVVGAVWIGFARVFAMLSLEPGEPTAVPPPDSAQEWPRAA